MGNGITSYTYDEYNIISDRLPWILDPFQIIMRLPERTIPMPFVYEKQKDEESSEKESEEEKNKEEK